MTNYALGATAIASLLSMSANAQAKGKRAVAGATGSIASSASVRVSGTSNAALMSMPTVVAADDSQTAATLESTFGMSFTSESKNFEVSSDAKVQLLVGVRK